MRKITAVLLSLMMAFSNLAIFVYAEEPAEGEPAAEDTETITNEETDEPVTEETVYEDIIEQDDWHDVSAEELLPDNDDLLQGYFDELVKPKPQALFLRKKDAGDTLEGTDRQLYLFLKNKITQISDGSVSDTNVYATLKDLGLDENAVYTAEDLGVDYIVADGKINPDMKDSLYAKYGLSDKTYNKVVTALIYDLPYEFFWFDKTIGYQWKLFSVGASYRNGQYVAYLTDEDLDDRTHVMFRVEGEYRKDADVESVTDAAKIRSVSGAAAYAKEIVSNHSSEDDYHKLVSYRDVICELTDYNYEAAGTPGYYGNPWQLIWVFDRDPSTKVVCEGYAKAFQYLCDLSDFKHNIECIPAVGQMIISGKGGAHMWNIVTMEDGLHYLADITNCDNDSIGEGDGLFLVGGQSTDEEMKTYTVRVRNSSSTVTYEYNDDTVQAFDLKTDLNLNSTNYTYDPSHIWVEGISIDQKEVSVKKGSTVKLNATVTPADATVKDVLWTSADTSVATVDSNGNVTGVSSGTTTITATSKEGGYKATCKVTVPVPVKGITIDKTNLTVPAGSKLQMHVTFDPEDATDTGFVWYWDDADAADITEDGYLIGKKPGKVGVKVVADDGGFEDSCTVRILFDDVTSKSQYYYDAVYWAADNNITTGMGPTSFNPSGLCKRYQFVLFLWRQENCPEPKETVDPFEDVLKDPNKDIYEKAVLWAVENKITTGTTPTTFEPYAPLTRGQVVTFLYRAAHGADEGDPGIANPFKDVDSSKYYYTPVLWAVKHEITTGVKPDQFQPTVTCTRGQTVLFMYRQFNK